MFFMKFESIVYRTGSCSLATFFARCADNYSLPLVPRPPPVFLLLKCCSRGSKIVTVSAAVHETNFGVLLLFFGQCRVIHTVSPSLCSVSLKLHYLPIIKYTHKYKLSIQKYKLFRARCFAVHYIIAIVIVIIIVINIVSLL